MTNNTDQLEPDEARKELDSIHLFERIGLQRGIPPLWFGITIALLGGITCTLAGLNVSRLYLAPLVVLMVLLVLRQTLKADVIVKPLLSKRALIVLAIGTAVIVMPLILFARSHLDTFGGWVALSIGVGIAIACSVASILERHKYLTRIDVEKRK